MSFTWLYTHNTHQRNPTVVLEVRTSGNSNSASGLMNCCNNKSFIRSMPMSLRMIPVPPMISHNTHIPAASNKCKSISIPKRFMLLGRLLGNLSSLL